MARSYDEYMSHCPACEECLSEDDHRRITGCLEDVKRMLYAASDQLHDTSEIAPNAHTGADTTPRSVLDALSASVHAITELQLPAARTALAPCGPDAHVTCKGCLRRLRQEARV